jgi:hypothetical protein
MQLSSQSPCLPSRSLSIFPTCTNNHLSSCSFLSFLFSCLVLSRRWKVSLDDSRMVDRSVRLAQHIIHTVFLASLAQASLWTVDIDNGPAPSPEDGPPLSLHASRNSSLLAGQICGIIGAYLATVFILGSLLLTVGRRLRRAALSAYLTTSMEMVKPTIKQFDDSPLSPQSQRSWYSPRRLKKKRSMQGSTRTVSNPGSPAVQSIASFDPGVIEADRVARQQELEHLYAAALAQEAAKSRTTVTEDETPLPETTSSRVRRQPPRLLTSAPALAHLHLQDSQVSPVSPRSPIRAIYPPRSPHFLATSPISPMRPDYGQAATSPNPRMPISPGVASTRTRTSSFGSQVEGKRPRKGLRNLRIQHRHHPSEVSDEEVRTPLTPRYYTDSGVPPSTTPRSEAPTTPGTHDGYGTPVDIETFDEIRAMPRPEPQRAGSYQYEICIYHGNSALPSHDTIRWCAIGITWSGHKDYLSRETSRYVECTSYRHGYTIQPLYAIHARHTCDTSFDKQSREKTTRKRPSKTCSCCIRSSDRRGGDVGKWLLRFSLMLLPSL